jgi:hypothetical protein
MQTPRFGSKSIFIQIHPANRRKLFSCPLHSKGLTKNPFALLSYRIFMDFIFWLILLVVNPSILRIHIFLEKDCFFSLDRSEVFFSICVCTRLTAFRVRLCNALWILTTSSILVDSCLVDSCLIW